MLGQGDFILIKDNNVLIFESGVQRKKVEENKSDFLYW